MIEKKILILLPTGMTIRNFLTTKLIEQLLENSNHEIICCVSDPERYKNYLSHPRLDYERFHQRKGINLNHIFIWILRRRFYSIHPNPTSEILSKSPLFSSIKGKLAPLLKYPFPRSNLIFDLLKLMSRKIYQKHKLIDQQIKKIKPDLVFATHLVSKDEYDYLMTASVNNIPTIGMVKSFDNLTSKGFLPYETDSIIVWNKIMQQELISLHDYKNEDIYITGVPQFDIYKEEPSKKRVEFFREYGLDDKRKIILYATNHHDISPDDPKNIEFISNYLNGVDAQLIVRLHQMDNIERYGSLKHDNIIYQVPGHEQGIRSDERVADRTFIKNLRDTLFFSDVTINTASTMSLDAIALDKPVINIAYDFEEKQYFESVKRFYDFVHYQPIINSSATSVAESKHDLLEYITMYLDDPSIKAKERLSIRIEMLNGQNGNASEMVVNSLLGFADKL